MSSSLRRVIAAFLLVFLMNGALAQDAAPAEAAAPDESAPPVAAEPAAPVKHIVAGDRLNVRGMVRLVIELYDLLYLHPDYPIVDLLDELRSQMR